MMRQLTAFAVVLASSTVALAADPTGPEILKKVDESLNAFNTGKWDSKLLVYQKDGKAREFGFTTFQKAPDKRLVRFTSPGDVKGMGVLIENKDTMYVYLPGFNKIRRMGTHIRNQTFMGSEFGFDDMSSLAYGDAFDAKLAGSDGNAWILELSAKPKIETDTPKLKMWVDKEKSVPLKVEYYDAGGTKLKTQLREDYKKDSPRHWQPMKITVINERNGHKSEIQFLTSEIDSQIGDDVFTQRSLLRGN
jgi:outer membrane lipoprotein-sorting protein